MGRNNPSVYDRVEARRVEAGTGEGDGGDDMDSILAAVDGNKRGQQAAETQPNAKPRAPALTSAGIRPMAPAKPAMTAPLGPRSTKPEVPGAARPASAAARRAATAAALQKVRAMRAAAEGGRERERCRRNSEAARDSETTASAAPPAGSQLSANLARPASAADIKLTAQIEHLEAELAQSDAVVAEQARMLGQLNISRAQQMNDLREQLGLEIERGGLSTEEEQEQQACLQLSLLEQLRAEFAQNIENTKAKLLMAEQELRRVETDVRMRGAGVRAAAKERDEAAAALIQDEEELQMARGAPLESMRRDNAVQAAALRRLRGQVAEAEEAARMRGERARESAASAGAVAQANADSARVASELDERMERLSQALQSRHDEVEALNATIARERAEREQLIAQQQAA